MAQIFTIDFPFRHMVHSAIISVRSLGNDHSVSVQLDGPDLKHIVPDGELSFRLSNTSRQPIASPGAAYNELEQALREAVTRHIRQWPAKQ